METMTAADLIDLLRVLAEEMPAHQEELRDLDAQMGDGDLGITVTLGMKGIADGLDELQDAAPGMILARSGMNFNRAAASTFGAIFATALMSAGKQLGDREEITVADLPVMLEAAASGVSARGGARPGEKTVLDVLLPMAEAMKAEVAAGSDLPTAAARMAEACRTALEATRPMVGRHGRGGWLKEKSIGLPDPGSTAICLMVERFARFVAER